MESERIDVNGLGSDLKSPESGMIIGSGNQRVPPDMMFDPVIGERVLYRSTLLITTDSMVIVA